MWPISLTALPLMVEREREDGGEKKKKKKKIRSLFKKPLSAGAAVNIWGISEVKIFLELSHLRRRKERESGRVSNRYHP